MAEHSPCPWTPRYSIAGPISEVVDAEGLVICEMVLPVGGIPVSDSNAKHMAAAPELVEGLELMLKWHDCDGWCALAHDALAKAKGEAQNG